MREVPRWVPPVVAAIACDMHRSLDVSFPRSSNYAAAIERLATDRRMQSVWHELLRRNRAEPRPYFHPVDQEAVRTHPMHAAVRRLTNALPEPEKLQHEAIALLFVHAAQLFS